MILDDFDSRPGSATSLLRTFVGSQLRQLGGWISTSNLVQLMGVLGVSANGARSAITRVKSKGLIVPELSDGQPGYRVNVDAVPMLESGDRRIFTFRQQKETDLWCLISFSIPEARRDARHQLRRRLEWIGCGMVTMGLWISPAALKGEVVQILEDLDLSDCATLFIAGHPEGSRSLAQSAEQWWDLGRLTSLHESFIERHRQQVGPASSDAEAFSQYIHALDQWRIIPYLDPGLPDSALPKDWPGKASVELFGRISRSLAPRAHRFALATTR